MMALRNFLWSPMVIFASVSFAVVSLLLLVLTCKFFINVMSVELLVMFVCCYLVLVYSLRLNVLQTWGLIYEDS